MSLRAEGITFGYPGGRVLYQGLSLEVEPGERVALRAPSGAGKTTLCRLLAGYLEPSGGRVVVDGEPLAPLARRRGAAARAPQPVQLLAQHPEQAFDPRMRLGKSLREGVAGLPGQERAAALAQLDAYAAGSAGAVGSPASGGAAGSAGAAPAAASNCASRWAEPPARSGAGASDATRSATSGEAPAALSVSDLLAQFGIRPAWFARFPHELSGGELMRLAMVRALLARPRYLIADESTAMLDALTQAQLWRALIAQADARGLGMVVVSHSPALVSRIATRVVDL